MNNADFEKVMERIICVNGSIRLSYDNLKEIIDGVEKEAELRVWEKMKIKCCEYDGKYCDLTKRYEDYAGSVDNPKCEFVIDKCQYETCPLLKEKTNENNTR